MYPATDLDGEPMKVGSDDRRRPGDFMKFRYVLVQVKADWMEMSSTCGLPSWGSFFAPCPMCACRADTMYSYDEVCMDDDAWGQRVRSYNKECSRCEIVVDVVSEEVRRFILVGGGLYSDPNRQLMGRTLARDIPALRLRAGDRLEPSRGMRDTMCFDRRAVPFQCVFWRQHRDDRGRLATFTLRRNPIFSSSIGTCPTRTLHLDTLHTLYIGVFAFYVHAVIHSMWADNAFCCEGAPKAKLAANLDVFFSLYKRWCSVNGVPQSYQLSSLTPSMIGEEHRPGLKLKAAETGVLMRFCVHFCRTHQDRFSKSEALLAAGEALEEYMQILKSSAFRVPLEKCARLLFLCLRFLRVMQRAGFKDMPKAHMFVHVTKRARFCGNPISYSCFRDETLNLTLANIASSSHRVSWHEAVFLRVRLLPRVRQDSDFAIV